MTRAELMADLWEDLQSQFIEIGLINEDSSGNLKRPIDRTLRAFGTARAAFPTGTISDADEDNAILVARYYGLEMILLAASKRVTTSMSAGTPSVSKSVNWSEYVKNITDLMKMAKADAAPYLPSDGVFSGGFISIGFIPSSLDIFDEWGVTW